MTIHNSIMMCKYFTGLRTLIKYNSLFQLFTSRLFVQGTTILQSIVVSRLLGPDGKGEFTEAILWPTLVASLSMMGLYTAIVRLSAKTNICKKYNVTSSVINVTLLTGTIGMIISLLINSYIFKYQSFLIIAQFYSVYALIYNVNRGLSAINNGRGRMDVYSISSTILNPVFFLCIFVLFIFNKIGIESLLLSLLFANFCSLAFLFYKRDKEKGLISIPTTKMLRYSIRFSPSDFSEPLYAYYDKAIIAFILSTYDLGIYTIAYSAASLVNIVSSTFAIQLFSDVARSNTQKMYYYIRINLIIMLIVSFCMSVCLPFAIPIIFGNAFCPSVSIAILLLPVCILQGQSTIIEKIILAKGFPYVGVQAKIITVCFFSVGAFALKYLGISSLLSLAILLIFSQFLYLCYMYCRLQRIFHKCRVLPNIEDYNYLKIKIKQISK